MKQEFKDIKPKEMIPRFLGRFVHSDLFTLAYWEVNRGSVLPEHSHENVQSSQVISGQFELTVDGEKILCEPDSVVVVPANAVHSGVALTNCVIYDVFSPARPEYSND